MTKNLRDNTDPPFKTLHAHRHEHRFVTAGASPVIGQRCWEIMKPDLAPATPPGFLLTAHLNLQQSPGLKARSLRTKLMEKKQRATGEVSCQDCWTPFQNPQQSRETVWCQIFQTETLKCCASEFSFKHSRGTVWDGAVFGDMSAWDKRTAEESELTIWMLKCNLLLIQQRQKLTWADVHLQGHYDVYEAILFI